VTDTAEKKLEDRGLVEFVATPACVDLPQSLARGCGFRYRYFHAERWGCMVDGVTRCRADLRRAHPDRCFATIFSAGPSSASAGDIFDRRKLVLATELWMMGVANSQADRAWSCVYLIVREPVMRMSTSLLALCCQSGPDATWETPISARSRSNGSRSLRMSPLFIARLTNESIAPWI